MCDNYSKETGYLCNSCKRELVNSKPKCIGDVIAFMKTPKDNYTENGEFSLEKLFAFG